MKKLLRVLIVLVLNVAFGFALAATTQPANAAVPLVKSVSARILGRSVKVQVKGTVVDIGSQSNERPAHPDNSCTYSRFPCVILSSMSIIVDGNELFLPRSVFADLSDVTSIELGVSGKQMLLTMKGGDASEAYAVKVLFSKDQVTKRLLYSALQDPPVQETTYFKTEELN